MTFLRHSRRRAQLTARVAFIGCLTGGFSLSAAARADYKFDIGQSSLALELGALLPTGAGIPVAQVEGVEGGVNYAPNQVLTEFSGKTFNLRSGASGVSSHATTVALYQYGNPTSIAPGITLIESYDANDWIAAGLLRYGNAAASPLASPQASRITNHSWVSELAGPNPTNTALDILLRADWVAEQDDNVQIVGVNNGSAQFGGDNTKPLMTYALNAISVGRTDGFHAVGTVPLGSSVYGANHVRPTVVVPVTPTSNAVPIVSAATALLIEAAQDNPAWSSSQYTSIRTGQAIRAAETNEILRATIMAGANREVTNGDGSGIWDYRGSAGVQTANGLDTRYGAGQLNIRNSYRILAGGQQRSKEDGRVADILHTGFDYDGQFGSAVTAGTYKGTYEFNGAWTGQAFTAALAWNTDININQVRSQSYNTAAKLYDLNLRLFDITGGGKALVAASASTTENSENFTTTLTAGRRYRMEVESIAAAPFQWNYGLAWNGTSNIVWTGLVNNAWDVNSTVNWQRGVAAAKYLEDDRVVFTDLGANTNIQLAAAVQPGMVTFDNSAKNYAFSGAAIAGPTYLTKSGAGSVTFNAANTYTGGTLIQNGTIGLNIAQGVPQNSNLTVNAPGQFDLNGFAQVLDLLSGNGTVKLGNGALTAGSANGSSTFSGFIDGTGSVAKTGVGNWTLASPSNYSGVTTISGGKLIVTANTALGSAAAGTVVNAGGSLQLDNNVNYSTPEQLTLNGNGSTGLGAFEAAPGTVQWSGPVTMGSNSAVGGAGTLVLNGTLTIPNGRTLFKFNSGTVRLAGSMVYGDGSIFFLSAGTLELFPSAGSTVSLTPFLPAFVLGSGTTMRVDATHNDPFTDDTVSTLHAALSNNSSNLIFQAGAARTAPITGTGAIIVNSGASLTADRLKQARLTINSAAAVTQPAHGGAAGMTILNNTPNAGAALTMTGSAVWDIYDNDALIYYNAPGPNPPLTSQIQQYIDNWYANAVGVPKISSEGVIATGGQTVLIALDNGVTGFGDLRGSPFNGEILGDSQAGTGFNQIILRYTWGGDYDLNGVVDALDYAIVDTNLGATVSGGGVAGWRFGDGDFDGKITPLDYSPIDANLGKGIASPLATDAIAPLAFHAVPEPSLYWGAALAGLLAFTRWLFLNRKRAA